MDRMSIIRSMHHDNGDHFAAAHWMLTGYHGSTAANLAPQYPSAGSIIARLKGASVRGCPRMSGSRTRTRSASSRLPRRGLSRRRLQPVLGRRRPEQPDGYQVPNLLCPPASTRPRFDDRRGLLDAFDHARRDSTPRA